MKQFAQNSIPLSLVPTRRLRLKRRTQEPSTSFKESFDGWLSLVAPILLHAQTLRHEPKQLFHGLPPITSTDEVRVDRATIREGRTHRHWPREVVEAFLAAEVITRK
ncbi:MAG: hypothetical protein ABR501_08925 [Pyrinomonadaceae bacterium]